MKKYLGIAGIFIFGVIIGILASQYNLKRSERLLALSLLSQADQSLSSGDLAKAIEFSVLSIHVDPKNYYAYILLGEGYSRIDNVKVSRTYYQQALNVIQTQPDVTEIGRKRETEKLRKIISGLNTPN